MNPPWVCMCPLPLEAPSHSIPLLWVLTEYQVMFLVTQQLPVSCFTRAICVFWLLLSQFAPPSPSPGVCSAPSPFCVSVSLFLSCKQVHQDHFSRFHICALIYDICFSLSDLRFTLYNRLCVHLPHWNWLKHVLFDGWIIFHYIYVPQLCYPFICWWISRLLWHSFKIFFVLHWRIGV